MELSVEEEIARKSVGGEEEVNMSNDGNFTESNEREDPEKKSLEADQTVKRQEYYKTPQGNELKTPQEIRSTQSVIKVLSYIDSYGFINEDLNELYNILVLL
jgi:hypothetical protein